MQLSEYELKSLRKLEEAIRSNRWSNEALVKLIKLAGEYLNIKTVPDYAKGKGISYVAARKDTFHRKNSDIFGVKFVIDND